MASKIGVGLMSGTSADGVDSALVKFSRAGKPKLLFCDFIPFTAKIKKEINSASKPDGTAELICSLNVELGRIFGEAALRLCEKAKMPIEKINFVGSHGQTIRHQPSGKKRGVKKKSCTLQIGESAEIAQKIGCVVVSDFRPADIAAGGCGAPLAPIAHHAIFSSKKEDRIVQNLGGISNVTFLPHGGALENVSGFDTGPANSLLDLASAFFSKNRRRYDAGGKIALKGKADDAMFSYCISHPYYAEKTPKSTGRETFGAVYFNRLIKKFAKVKKEDFLRTLSAVTAESAVRQAAEFFKPAKKTRWIVCGGGAKNMAVLLELENRLKALGMRKPLLSPELGWPEKSVEPFLMALLAYRTLKRLPGNIPTVTGAKLPVILGKICGVPPLATVARG